MKNTSPPMQRYKSGGGRFLPALCNILGTLILLTMIAALLLMILPGPRGDALRQYPVVGAVEDLLAGTVGRVYALIFAACGVMFHILAERMRDRRREALRLRLQAEMRESLFAPAAAGETASAVAGPGPYRRWGDVVRRVLMVVLAAVFIFSSVSAWLILRQYRQGEAVYADLSARFTREGVEAAETGKMTASLRPGAERELLIAPIQVDFQALLAENSDVIGWIYCEDTAIDYPVVRGETNDYYLHRGLDRDYSVFGSIFQEAANSPEFRDHNNFLYGHHMRDGSMFAGLGNWTSQAYYEEHPVLWLLTPQGDYRLDPVAGYTTSADSDTYTVFREAGPELDAYMQAVLARSNFTSETELPADGRYLVLSTCAYVFDDARYVLHCLMVPADSAGGVPMADQAG